MRLCFCHGLFLVALSACAGGAGHSAALESARAAAPRGSQVFARDCSGCHGKEGEGHGSSPALIGPGTLPPGGSAGPLHTAADLFAYVKREMPLPRSHAGSLSDPDYWAVVTFLVAARHRQVPPGGIDAANAAGVSLGP